MQPSSLVFLVIIAVWAAFFLQYWVRRREHLSTARSVDQFSEAMRVLERRSPLPATDLSTPAPRSYAVVPARAARPQILVKRAETATASGPSSAAPSASPAAPDAFDAFDSFDAVDADGAAPLAPRAGSGRAPARRARALVMLGALSTVLVAVPLLVLGMLPAWVAAVPVACVAVAVAFARVSTQAERRTQVSVTRSEQVRRAAPAPPARPVTAESPGSAPVDSSRSVAHEVAAEPEPAPVAPREELFDVQAVEARRAAAPAVAVPRLPCPRCSPSPRAGRWSTRTTSR